MIAQFLPDVLSVETDLASTILVTPPHYPRIAADLMSDRRPASRAGYDSPCPKISFGEYELIGEIARGGMGAVYKARQLRLNRIVALKTVLPVPYPSAASADALRWEAEVGASLDHPGIVPVHDFGESDGWPFLCMTLVDGESLAARIRRGPMRPQDAARIVAEVAEAIQYVHDCGLLHRDIKPANILIDSTGRARVIDFGLAIRSSDQDSAMAQGAIVGTPLYMSPEQATGRTDLVGPESDVFSLGAVLHELLVGQPPFPGRSSGEILKRFSSEPSKSVGLEETSIPETLRAICRCALRWSADSRYASAGELGRDLRREV